jgi:hypothetical protein
MPRLASLVDRFATRDEQVEEEQLASREKGGFWVGAVAVFFYPLNWMAKVTQRGNERIPREGGVLLVMNHVSHYDPIVDAVFVHRNKRVPRILAKESVLRIPDLRLDRPTPLARSPSTGAPPPPGTASPPPVAAHERGPRWCSIYPEADDHQGPDGWPMYPRTRGGRPGPGTATCRWLPVPAVGTKADPGRATPTVPRPLPPQAGALLGVGEPGRLSAYRGPEGHPGAAA